MRRVCSPGPRFASSWPLVVAVGAAVSCAGAPLSPGSPSALPARAGETPGAAQPQSQSAPPTAAEAASFIADVERHLRVLWPARDRAAWVHENFITDDTEALAEAGEEATAAYLRDAIRQARRYDAIRSELPADVARKLYLLSVSQTIPAPGDPAKRAELAGIETWMTSAYGKGQYCPPPGSALAAYIHADRPGGAAHGEPSAAEKRPGGACLRLDDLERVLETSRKPGELAEAWRGWHAIAAPMKEKYARYVALADEGATDIGFADVGALWRAGYDMAPAAFEADVERLWSQVKPLYDALHCDVRARLQAVYGKQVVPDRAPIPAHLLGNNMWAQEWTDVDDLVVPYPGEPSVDIGKKLREGG